MGHWDEQKRNAEKNRYYITVAVEEKVFDVVTHLELAHRDVSGSTVSADTLVDALAQVSAMVAVMTTSANSGLDVKGPTE